VTAITLRELDGHEVGELRGVGERKRAALKAFGIETVLDLLMTYPRRWVDRTNEARVADLRPGTEALVLASS
jgi:ATP-dependent DNA helicase RecG